MKCPKSSRAKKLDLSVVLRALGDPIRLHIVRLASEGERACNEFGLDLPKATLFHHFNVLREAGVIVSRAQGRRHLTRVRTDELNAQFPGLLDSVLGASVEK